MSRGGAHLDGTGGDHAGGMGSVPCALCSALAVPYNLPVTARPQPMRALIRIATLLALATLAPATARAAPPAGEPDAGEADTAPAPEPVRCATDAASPRLAVEAAYAEFARLYRARLPGPRGQTILETRLDALVDRLIDVEAFARAVLAGAWNAGTTEQRAQWQRDLDQMLRRRYLKGLEDPHLNPIDVLRSDVSCDRASVRVRLGAPSTRSDRVVELDLIYREPEWRVYNVTVDGVSLIRTWRSRLRRVFADGGVDALDRQLRLLAERYARRGAVGPPD